MPKKIKNIKTEVERVEEVICSSCSCTLYKDSDISVIINVVNKKKRANVLCKICYNLSNINS